MHYRKGSNFRHLRQLYEADELTGAINRVIEDMNHRFLLRVLTKDFVSSDLGSARQLLRKESAAEGSINVLDYIDTDKVTDRLRHILEIRNLPEI